MKKFVYVSGAAVLAATLLGTPAFAGPGDALDVTLGPAITNLLGSYSDGSFSNMAVNNANIDGSVTATSAQAIVTTSTTNAADGTTGSASSSTTETATILNQTLGDVKTSAIGSVNEGTIKLNAKSVSADINVNYEQNNSTANANSSGATAVADFTSLDGSLNYISEGVPTVAATNIAFNNANINGSVTLNGLGASGVATSALGAANIGTIEVGQ